MIPLFSAASANMGIDLSKSFSRVIDRNWYVLGEEVSHFESEFSSYIGVSHCVSVANGTDALEIALRGLGVGPGKKVVTVANAGFYSSTAIHSIGAIPLYVDVERTSMTMDVDSLEQVLKDRPAAVIVTHLYGQLANIEVIVERCRREGIAVIEDCAQAHGASRNGKQAGSFGDVGCFSFYPTKNLGAVGDGGAIVTNSSARAEVYRKLRQYGWSVKYTVGHRGGRNSRLDELQAAVLRDKLPHLSKWNAMRRDIAKRYNSAFSSISGISLPSVGEDYVAHLYVLRVEAREEFREFLRARSIATDIHYPIPDHRQPAYETLNLSVQLPITDELSRLVVSLPCYPGLASNDIDLVIDVVSAWFTGK